MKMLYGVKCLLMFINIGSTPAISAQFEDEEAFPEIKQLMFSQDAVGFVSNENRFYFIYDRSNRHITEVDAIQFKKHFPGNPPEVEPHKDPSQPYYLIGHTTSGVEYKSRMKYCGEGVTDEIRKVVVNNKVVKVQSREECTNVSSIEIVNDQLWLGTAYFGEAVFYKGAEGVIVQGLNGKAVLARIATDGAVIQIKSDPFSNSVWVVTYFGIYEISRQFKILSANYYSSDFEPSSGEPRFFFSTKVDTGNSFSEISRRLPKADRMAFYEAVTKIPKTDLKRFSLYDFFMGCSQGYDDSPGDRPEGWPKSFMPLFPFFIKVNPQCANPNR